MGRIFHLSTPLSEEDVRQLAIDDQVYLSGDAFCMLYASHYTMLLEAQEKGEPLPMDLAGKALYNTGVIWRKENGRNVLYALGTTASYKFNAFGPAMIRRFGVRAMIGKGGMDEATLEAMRECGCVFLAISGGATALFTPKAEIAEEYLPAVPPLDNQRLRFRLHEFGPLLVTMDAHGHSIYKDAEALGEERKKNIYAALRIQG